MMWEELEIIEFGLIAVLVILGIVYVYRRIKQTRCKHTGAIAANGLEATLWYCPQCGKTIKTKKMGGETKQS